MCLIEWLCVCDVSQHMSSNVGTQTAQFLLQAPLLGSQWGLQIRKQLLQALGCLLSREQQHEVVKKCKAWPDETQARELASHSLTTSTPGAPQTSTHMVWFPAKKTASQEPRHLQTRVGFLQRRQVSSFTHFGINTNSEAASKPGGMCCAFLLY